MSLRDALTRNHARTAPDADDPRLRGREYAHPFGTVWKAALQIASASPGWSVTATDPRAGNIVAEARTRWWKFVDDVEIRVSLDARGLTRVDVASRSRVGSMDLGTNARRIVRFLKQLDARLHQG